MPAEIEKKGPSVCAIIVAYCPEADALPRLVAALAEQVEQIVVVDNSPAAEAAGEQLTQYAKTLYLGSGVNQGVAAGHNQGISWALEQQRFSHVLLLDQDSVPHPKMVSKLLATEKTLRAKGIAVAAVGPQPVAPQSARCEPLLCPGRWGVVKKNCDEQLTVKSIETLYIITSGSLIGLEVVKKIGLLEEAFFIDLVDVEWGLRARSKGFATYVACNARMNHAIGCRKEAALLPLKAGFAFHGPLRLYYQCRNYLLLLRKRYVFFPWSVYYLARHLLPRCFIFCFLSPPRDKNFHMIVTGFIHGLLGRKGAYLPLQKREHRQPRMDLSVLPGAEENE